MSMYEDEWVGAWGCHGTRTVVRGQLSGHLTVTAVEVRWEVEAASLPQWVRFQASERPCF